MNDTAKKLFTAAVNARANAHAPYSGFCVGAAIFSGGTVYSGCNVENAAYPQSLCAEAAAVAAMVTAGGKRIDEILIVADGDGVAPCGGCLQKISEFADGGVNVTVATPEGKIHCRALRDYLPLPFAL